MSKQKKEQQKKRKKEQVRKERLAKYRAELTATRGRDDGFLDHIFDLTRERDYKKARDQLLAYVEKYPKYPQPYVELAKVCVEIGDRANMYWATEQLLQVGQRTLEDYVMHYAACALNGMPATMLACAEQMERRFQHKSETDTSVMRKELLDSLRSNSALVGDDVSPYSDEQLLELMRLLDRSPIYLSLHRFGEAIKCCEEMTSRFPFVASGFTNKALAMMLDKGPDAAEPLLQHALEKHPNALFVIAFKIRQLALLGRHEEIPAYCERLAAVPPDKSPSEEKHFIGKIEAFAWADDLDRVIETYQLAKKALEDDWDVDQEPYALATHYAAVAYARQGDRETAIRLWKLLPPELIGTAKDNLEDIQKPIAERNGPWFFDFEHWVPYHFYTTLYADKEEIYQDEHLDEEEREERFERILEASIKKMLSHCPSFDRVLIEMLKRGEPDCQTFVRLFIERLDTPAFRAAALDFALGQSGSDECRREFMMSLARCRWLETDTVKMWVNGEQHEIQFTGAEIYWDAKEQEFPLSPEGQEKHRKARDLGNEGRFKKAMELLTEVNDNEPGHPSVLFNIASYRKALGDEEGYGEIIDQLLRDFPDYFFAQTAQVQRLCKQRRLDEAFALLKPLQMMKRLHISEYKSLTNANIIYHVARGEMEVAESLRQSGIEVAGDVFSSLETFQEELEPTSNPFNRLLKNLMRPQREEPDAK